jgi:hypothetical protein
MIEQAISQQKHSKIKGKLNDFDKKLIEFFDFSSKCWSAKCT